MTDWLMFAGRLEPMEWGRATYTILRVSPPVAASLASLGARRVEGEINDHPVNLALSRAPVVEGVFLWIGRSLLDRLGVEPGERLEVRLQPAPADAVDTPDDAASALRAAGLTEAWSGLTPGRRRGMIHQIDSARTEATRAKRIASLTAHLSAVMASRRAGPRRRLVRSPSGSSEDSCRTAAFPPPHCCARAATAGAGCPPAAPLSSSMASAISTWPSGRSAARASP